MSHTIRTRSGTLECIVMYYFLQFRHKGLVRKIIRLIQYGTGIILRGNMEKKKCTKTESRIVIATVIGMAIFYLIMVIAHFM